MRDFRLEGFRSFGFRVRLCLNCLGPQKAQSLVVLADVVANVQVQHLAIRQTDDFVAILGKDWVLAKEVNKRYHNKEHILFTIDPYSLNKNPEEGREA